MRNDAAWWKLKDKAKARNHGQCEYCSMRYVDDLHHRHYTTYGQETLPDVMAVCRLCHDHIHGNRPWGSSILVAEDSLCNLGDTGSGDTPMWLVYVSKKQKERDKIEATLTRLKARS